MVQQYLPENHESELVLTLTAATKYQGTVKDGVGKPVVGAEVICGQVHQGDHFFSTGFPCADCLRGTPFEKFYLVKTDATGTFRFKTAPAGTTLIFRTSAEGFATNDGPKWYPAGENAKPAEITLIREAVVTGRVISRVAGIEPEGLVVRLRTQNLWLDKKADKQGQFTFRGLPAGEAVLTLDLPERARATYRYQAVTVKEGESREVTLEVIEGVEVTGTVRICGINQPAAGVWVSAVHIVSPRPGMYMVKGQSVRATCDSAGRFVLRLPPGETTVHIEGAPGYGRPVGLGVDERMIVVPDGVKTFAMPGPLEVVAVVDKLAVRVTDAAGKAVPHVKVYALRHSNPCGNFASEPVTASFDGECKLQEFLNGPAEPGHCTPLWVELSDGRRFETSALIAKDGVSEVRLPTFPNLAGPQDFKANELAGLVVDEKGKPLGDVKVLLRDRARRLERTAQTGSDGTFRFDDVQQDRQVEVMIGREGHAPVLITRQQVGVKGLVIALDRSTYFEGVVRAPDGKPVPEAVIRADRGPKMLDGSMANELVTEVKSDAQGRYRLYVQPDDYAFTVKVPGVGVARLSKTGIAHGQARTFDIELGPGVTFRARVIDSMTGKPVRDVRLYQWQKKDVDCRFSDERGEATIPGLLPGLYAFNVESDRHTRWWSEQVTQEWEQKKIDEHGWQGNFGTLTFDLKEGMAAVTITVEPAVRVRGKIVDPDGKPVAGATAALALERGFFEAESKGDGTFSLKIPASGATEYNLLVHDGKYGEWRTWANGISPAMKTTPGQTIEGVTLKLTRPAVVRGKVVDEKGQPAAGREVQAKAISQIDAFYPAPSTKTNKDGTFELKYIRAAKTTVQVSPYYVEPPPKTIKTLTLKESEVVENVVLVVTE